MQRSVSRVRLKLCEVVAQLTVICAITYRRKLEFAKDMVNVLEKFGCATDAACSSSRQLWEDDLGLFTTYQNITTSAQLPRPQQLVSNNLKLED